MDPFSRKLFTTRDAREHLRSMGGIMSSSPRLAETVAKFNLGGDVIAPVVGASQEPALVVFSGSNFAVFPDGRVVNTDANVEVDDTQDPGGDLRRAVQALAPGGAAAADVPPEVAATMTLEELRNIVDFEDITEPMRARGAEVFEPFQDTGASGAATFAAETLFRSRAAEMRARDAAAGREPPAVVQQRQAAEEDQAAAAAAMETEAEAGDAEMRAADQAAAAEQERQEAARRAAEELETSRGTGAGAGGDLDLDATFDQMLARLERVMGTKDEDGRKKAMANLAMIGLAIAAGQSPDALTNIAQGALTGMQAIRREEAAEEATQREMRLTALQMASAEVENRRKLNNALMVAGLRGTGGSESMRQEYLYNDIFRKAYEAELLEGKDAVSAIEIARQAAQQAAPAAPSAQQTGPDAGAGSVGSLTEEERRLLGLGS
jgi:hypothetical protein